MQRWLISLLHVLALVGAACHLANTAIAMGPTSTSAPQPANEKRFALLIGNQGYTDTVGPLKNPHNDVRLLAETLTTIGFPPANVRAIHDADRVTILGAVDAFAETVSRAGPDAVAVLYYSGHGAASSRDKRNYLIPVGVKALDNTVWYQAVALDDVVAKLSDRAPNAAHFVIFDACRNLLRMPSKGGKGFVPIAERRGMLIAFSTDPGQTASDEGSGAGPYAAALAQELARPNQHHLDLFQNVKERVYRATGAQVPWERNGLLKRIYLAGRTTAPQQRRTDGAEAAWSAIADSNDKAILEAYAQRYPDSFFAVLAKQRLAALAAPTQTAAPSAADPNGPLAATAGIGDIARKLPSGQLVLTAPKWSNAKGFVRVSQKEAEARLAGYTVVYGNGSREYHASDGTTKIWRKRNNAYSYGNWSVSATGRLSYRYGRREGCWGYILYNAATQQFRVDWRKAICKYGFARFLEGEQLR